MSANTDTGRAVSRRRLLLGSAAGAALAGLSVAAPARAAVSSTGRPAPVDVVVHPDSFTAPSQLRGGAVTFRVSTPEPGGRSLLLIKLKSGVSVDRYLTALAATSAYDPAQRAAAERELMACADNLGGAVVTPDSRVSFTQFLLPGTYHLVNFDYTSATAVPQVKPLTVTGLGVPRLPDVDDYVLHRERNGVASFLLPTRKLAATGEHLVVNSTRHNNEAVLSRLAPGATPQDVAEYFEAIGNGQWPSESPVTTMPVGLAPLSGGKQAIVRTELPAGSYLLYSYATSPVTGQPAAVEGLYRLITLV
ncbi:hypothetical protein O7606_09165 [Micromonospora sp. WMMD882]|uniref:hypothetical protein n=1 Tax=Micromonospora sp. WMMD882 TaxID=3015151 RepID=UPI00248BC1A1|nr:hypothetical protein [Micromonospora sp. WMMD882]WBB81506.1 hypothetical protein O7606_09165 [Micromonospora sp. WMMD882]